MRVCLFVCFLEAARAKPVSDEQEQLKSRLEKVEALNKTYERNLKENAGHMLTVIEKMQKMVDQVKSDQFPRFFPFVSLFFFFSCFRNDDFF